LIGSGLTADAGLQIELTASSFYKYNTSQCNDFSILVKYALTFLTFIILNELEVPYTLT